ncbi:MAG: prepilin-type N-terminal cleavage/methylation domain-containing protein [Pseudomonadota bacterium]
MRLPAKFQRGFTLVELLLVILILGTLALGTSFLVDGFGDQIRFDDTKSRLQQIRKAIIGDTNRTLNGQVDMSGFVADMGRLPESVEELVSGEGLELWNLSSVVVGTLSPVTIELYGGWRGPYLETFPESSTGRRAFRDGWGNADISGASADFGWIYSQSDLSGVAVTSLGADSQADDAGGSAEGYDKDFPTSGNLVEVADYQVSLNGGLTVRFNNFADIPEGVTLKLFYFNDKAGLDGPESDELPSLSGVQSVNVTFTAPDDIGNQGRYAAALICSNGNIYDGNCDAAHTNSQPYYFILVPRAQLPTILWNIQ